MDKEQARLKKEKRKAKAKKEREREKREKEMQAQWESEFKQAGEYRVSISRLSILIKIAGLYVTLYGAVFLLFHPNTTLVIKILALLYTALFISPLITDIKLLLRPTDALVVNETGILVQCFYSNPGQLYWEDLKLIDDVDTVDTPGNEGLFVGGFFVKLKNKNDVAARLSILKRIYFLIGSMKVGEEIRIALPSGAISTYEFIVTTRYFRGEWEKKQHAEKLEALDQQIEEQKRQEHSKQAPKK